MTELEICGSYRRGKDQDAQIRILSELTGKSEYEIMEIIVRGGYELPKKRINRLIKRMDTLNDKIWDMEQEYKEIYRVLTGTSQKKEREQHGKTSHRQRSEGKSGSGSGTASADNQMHRRTAE